MRKKNPAYLSQTAGKKQLKSFMLYRMAVGVIFLKWDRQLVPVPKPI